MVDSQLPKMRNVFLYLSLAALLAACGGGGGSGDPGFIGGGVPGDGGGGGDDPVSESGIVLSLALTDPDGNETTNITSVRPGTLTITATNASGQPFANQVVSASASIGVLLPDSGTALTDLNGVASFALQSDGNLGAGTVTVTLVDAQASVNYQVGEANLRIGRFEGSTFVEGEIEAGSTSLPAAGSTTLTVAVVDSDDVLVTSSVAVLFGSACANLSPPEAELTAEVNTVGGLATSTYTATGCSGIDNVTAGIVQGNSQTASVSLDVASAAVNSISFLSATPAFIALKGTGGEGRQESSSVEFQVLDATGAPVQGYDVDFSLSTTIGGLSLTNDSATTNSEGIARAIVLAGNVSTSVRVTATILVDGEQRSTVSDKLVVSTGLPDQNSLSISVGTFNPGGGDVDGVTTNVNVRLADKFNNPVPDGTTVFFTTEYGVITDTCETSAGVCSVDWSSQEPREPLIYNNFGGQDYISTIDTRTCSSTSPSGTGVPCVTNGTIAGSDAVGLGQILGRRSTVLVTAIGEESFVDTNGNGLYDVGEQFQDMGEAFLDNNENRSSGSWLDGYDGDDTCTPSDSTQSGRDCASGLEETFVDFDADGVYTDGNGIYNGSLCPEALEASGDCSRELVSVRGDLTITMPNTASQRLVMLNSSDSVVSSISLPTGGGIVSFSVVVADRFNNMPPAGSTVTVGSDACELVGITDFTIPNTSATGAYRAFFSLAPDPGNTETESGLVTVELAIADGDSPAALQISCTDPAG